MTKASKEYFDSTYSGKYLKDVKLESVDDRIKRFVDSAYKNYNDTKEQLYTEVNSGADDEYIRSIYDEKSLESR